MSNQEREISFQETDQSFLQLGLILGSGFGLVSSLVGAQISKIYGAGTAVFSILLGNFILWFIGLSIITMTQKRAHAIQNIKEHLGRSSSGIATVILVAAFVIWFALQIKLPAQVPIAIIKKFTGFESSYELKIGAILGSFCTLLSIGGIKSIKWVNIISFPILIISLALILLKQDHVNILEGPWRFSFQGTLLIILTWLPGTVNLSTFFRHSRSRSDSILGLSLMMICHCIFQFCFVLLNMSDPILFFEKDKIAYDMISLSSLIIFIFLSYLCVNLLNIYWASVGLEVFFRHKQEAKRYIIIGLLGTIVYVFLQSTSTIAFLEGLGTAFISNLGVMLVAGYLVKIVVQHRSRKFDKPFSSICWFIGCVTAIISLSFDPINVTGATLAGINACLLSLATIIFIEEMNWSVINLGKK